MVRFASSSASGYFFSSRYAWERFPYSGACDLRSSQASMPCRRTQMGKERGMGGESQRRTRQWGYFAGDTYRCILCDRLGVLALFEKRVALQLELVRTDLELRRRIALYLDRSAGGFTLRRHCLSSSRSGQRAACVRGGAAQSGTQMKKKFCAFLWLGLGTGIFDGF